MPNKLNKFKDPYVNKYKRFPLVDKSSGAKLYAYSIIASIKLENLDKDNPIDLTKYVMGISLEKNFEKLFCPMVTLVLSMPRGDAFALQDQYRDEPLVFTLERHIVTDEKGGISAPEPIYKGVNMSIVHIDGPAFIDDDASGDIETMSMQDSNDNVVLTVYMYETAALEIKRPLVNTVYKDVTISDVINLLVTNNFKDRKVIIEKPDNEEKYEQIFIPPLSFPDVIEYLQAFYGIYKSGVETFMDLDALYLISKDTDASYDDKYKDINIRVRAKVQQDALSKSKGVRSTFLDEETKTVNITLDESPNIESGDVVSKEFIGEDIYINNDKKIDVAKGGGGINPSEEDKGKKRYLWAKTSSDYATDEIALRINRRTEIANFTVSNTDITYLNPIAVIHLGYAFMTNDDVEAKYRLCIAHTTFTRGENSTLDKTYDSIFYAKTYVRFMRV